MFLLTDSCAHCLASSVSCPCLLFSPFQVFGTHWQPVSAMYLCILPGSFLYVCLLIHFQGDPAPPVWSEAEKIWSAYPKEYYGGGTAKVAAGDAKPGEEAETKKEAIAKVLEDNAASMESKASSTSSRRPRRSKD